MKEQLRNELIMAAQKGMDDDELDEFKDRLTMILSNYDIAARETHLALRDEDINKDLFVDASTIFYCMYESYKNGELPTVVHIYE